MTTTEHSMRPTGLSRRGFLAAAAAMGLSATLPGLASADPRASAAARPAGFAAAFAAPPRVQQGRFRWWWPHGLVDPAELRREIDQIADAGFGGVEIADVHHSVRDGLDPAGHGWGTRPWVDAVEAALEHAQKRDVTVDVTIGPSWPAAVPTIDPQSDAAVKELVHGIAVVAGGETFDGPLPEPAVEPEAGVQGGELSVVQAIRLQGDTLPSDLPYPVLLDSVVDLTADVEDGALRWTAPAEGTWVVVVYWLRGSGQRPEAGPHTDPISYVVDHFSAAGTRAIIDFWETHILTPRIRELVRANGSSMFEDSIEMETEATLWTPGLLAAFEEQLGYDLRPYLATVIEQDEDPVFTFDSVTDRRARGDLDEVRSTLYIDHHLRPLQQWLADLGMTLRIQPAGLETDSVRKAAILDVAEGETLGYKNLDDFRSLAGGRDLGGKRILSSETAAVFGGSYNTTWKQSLRTITREYAGGVNQAVLHGFSYAEAPGAQWPGHAAFTPYDGGIGYSESWGPRHPIWKHAPDVSAYLARNQMVLQSGRAVTDVAWLRQKGFAGSGLGAAWFSATGSRLGWTHQFISPGLLEETDPSVADGLLAPDGPGYKLVIFEGDAFAGRSITMPLQTARRLLDYARSGLRVICVGDWSQPTVPGVPKPGENAELAAVFAELLRQPTAHNAPEREDIPAALEALGLTPRVQYAQSSPLVHIRRHDDRAEYYYFTNTSDTETVDHDVTIGTDLRGGVPHRLDAWTGEIERIALYDSGADGLSLRIHLQPGDTTIVAVAAASWLGSPIQTARPAISTGADEVRFAGRGLAVRGSTPGTVTTTLQGGRTVRSTIPQLPTAVQLSRWRLDVEDWRPGDTPTTTTVLEHRVELDELRPWTDIEGLEDTAGIGHYTATVDLGVDWRAASGAYLELGLANDTVRVWVNGSEIGAVNQHHHRIDVGPLLRPGRNTVEVEVASTLINRMRVHRLDVYGSAERSQNGLLGPVRLVPYAQVTLP